MFDKSKSRFDPRLVLITTIILLQIILSASIFHHYWSPATCLTTRNAPQRSTCNPFLGNSKSQSCALDVLGQSWLPSTCYNVTFIDQDRQIVKDDGRSYDWYLDHKRSHHVPEGKIAEALMSQKAESGKGSSMDAWTRRSWQVEHCMHMLRVAAHTANRIVTGEKDVWVDERAADTEYAAKCMELIMGQVGLKQEELDEVEAVKFEPGRCRQVI